MTTSVNTVKLYSKLIEGAKKIGQIAEAETLEADKYSTVSQNVIDAIVEAGINRLIIPKEYGYPQINFTQYTNIVKEVGYYNLSAAWLTYFYALHNAWVAFLPKHRRDEIYHDGGLLTDIFAPVGKAEKVDGGFILNGRWNFVSGINYSKWTSLGALYFAPGEPAPQSIALCMKVSELELIQEWDSLGLRGSGSNTLIAKDLFVPEDMVINFNEVIQNRKPSDNEIDEEYLYYNRPFFPAFFVGFPAMCLGAAERVLNEFISQTKKRIRLDGSHEGQSPKSQRVAAELTIRLKEANGLMKQYIEMLETDTGQYNMGEYQGIRVKIVEHCVEIAIKVTTTLGVAALKRGTIIEVMLRDLITIGTHKTSLYEDGIESLGKALFDVPSSSIG